MRETRGAPSEVRVQLKHIVMLAVGLVVGAGAGLGSMVTSAAPLDEKAPPASGSDAQHQPTPPRGRIQVGKASIYAARYAERPMADGTPMKPGSNNAASLTLPLGTTAVVTNLDTGKAAIITIRDRGPYVKGRIVDLSPATARLIGLSKTQGLAPVRVVPLS